MMVQKVEGISGLGVFFYKDVEDKSRNVMVTILDLTLRFKWEVT
jgi:hypothetical protein